MNGFSLTTMFIVPDGTLAASGSTQDLTAGQLGLFRPDYSLATAGNIAAAKYFYIAQGRKESVPGLGSKRSDKIAAANVTRWEKSTSEDTAANQISEISDIHVKCGESVIFTFRVHSNLIETGFYNGYTKSVVVQAPCCDCGELPCEDIEAADLEKLIDEAVAKLNATGADNWAGQDVRISNFLSFQRTGSGAESKMLISAKPQAVASPLKSDISGNQFEHDRVWFRAFVRKGTDTTADFYVDDKCEQVATVTVLQRATYGTQSANEIRLMEQRYYSYQTSHFKHLHRNPDWNGAFESYVVDGKYYDLYYITANEYDERGSWGDKVPQDFSVIVAFESGEGSAFETVLTAALGAPTNVSANDVSTTTTTSTTSTTTTSTTTLQP
jgi:hypothetical protein